ncbi:5-hydroxytryptamine receptor 3A-like [Neolamprologus brichardi]|uniref:5-hydroxytryptamine receptor 3A-like n=1 Tax=Neolamprologus brichardi TaxID=32507 RepID=UPI001643AE9F|nr:5-hydroxytryptamine receptor 3A-like [Neolamprologus brichardi]
MILTDLSKPTMIIGFFFLLFFMGGNASSVELQDDQQTLNETITRGGNASSIELEDNQQMFNETFTRGENASTIEQQDDQQSSKSKEDEENSPKSCRYVDIINYLNLTQDKDMYIMTRPVENYSDVTPVYHIMAVEAILDVHWRNRFTYWDPDNFCGLENITFPTSNLWTPDLTIEERTDKDKETKSPYLLILWFGWVEYTNEQVVTTACKMLVYKFPFDVQMCNITFKSIMHSDNEIELIYNEDNESMTDLTRSMMWNQYEWTFENLTSTTKSSIMYPYQTAIIYTITMRRRSVLYAANFISPVLFFLVLDLASFLIPDAGGEKLSFKVTVLLAVTVLQLILNDILPSTSQRVPLIAIYCIGIFILMLLSLLETIVMMYLIEKDSAAHHNEMDEEQSLSSNCGDKWFKANFCVRGRKSSDCASVCDESADETQSVTEKRSSDKLTEVSLGLEQVSAELREIGKTISLLSSNEKEEKFGYWARMMGFYRFAVKVYGTTWLTALYPDNLKDTAHSQSPISVEKCGEDVENGVTAFGGDSVLVWGSIFLTE